MRIVFLNVTGSLGGAERVMLTLLGELCRLRPQWKLTVIAGEAGPLTDAVQALNIPMEVVPMPADLSGMGDWGATGRIALLMKTLRVLPSAIRYRKALRAKLRELAPDIVQTNGLKMHLLGALACPSAARLIWHVHDFLSTRRAMKTLLGWCRSKPAAIVAISPAVAKDLRSLPKVRTIGNAVDLSRYVPSHAINAVVRIGLAGTFARWKGHDVFLKALALLPAELAWKGVIVGGSVYQRSGSQWTEEELRAIIRQLGLEERVEFTGFLTDSAPAVQSLDIVVHASVEPEPFGLVIAEGMAAGRAVVTTSESIVTDNLDGVICRRGDAENLARAIERLARDPALRARLGEAAIMIAGEKFRPERMAREFIALYEALV